MKIFHLALTLLIWLTAASGADSQRTADPQWIDDKVDPCQDYYRYACGKWIDTHPLPADRPSLDRGLSAVAEENRSLLRDLLSGAKKPSSPLSEDEKKAQKFYAACMNEDQAERALDTVVIPFLQKVDMTKDKKDLAAFVAQLHLEDGHALFEISVMKDAKKKDLMIFNIAQGGLSLPNRDDYLGDSERSKKLREGVKWHIARMLHLAKIAPNAKDISFAEKIFGFELEIAKASRTPEQMRDSLKLIHRWDRAGLQKKTKKFPWSQYFEALGYPQMQFINVMVPENIVAIDKLWDKTPIDTLKLYLKWHYLSGAAEAMSKAISAENFAFYGRELIGRKEESPRWKRCVAATDEAMGDATGQLFTRETFNDEKQKKIDTMVANLRAAFEDNLADVSWLDAATRKAAREKLNLFISQVGKPHKWRSYKALEITDSDLRNRNSASVLNVKHEIDKVGKPIDRLEWEMSAPTVNAYYSPELNKIVFLAGILQPPTFNPSSSLASNYGSIGVVIGHEFTHGFDDQGSLYDGDGVMRNWWSKKTQQAFEKRGTCLADHYSAQTAVGGLHLNGKLTLGEAIGDLGGVKIAFRAMKKAVGKPSVEQEKDFFLGFAQTWCANVSDAFEQFRVLNDPHAPNRFRVNATLQNLPQFAQTYACKKNSAMNPEKSCEIW